MNAPFESIARQLESIHARLDFIAYISRIFNITPLPLCYREICSRRIQTITSLASAEARNESSNFLRDVCHSRENNIREREISNSRTLPSSFCFVSPHSPSPISVCDPVNGTRVSRVSKIEILTRPPWVKSPKLPILPFLRSVFALRNSLRNTSMCNETIDRRVAKTRRCDRALAVQRPKNYYFARAGYEGLAKRGERQRDQNHATPATFRINGRITAGRVHRNFTWPRRLESPCTTQAAPFYRKTGNRYRSSIVSSILPCTGLRASGSTRALPAGKCKLRY